MDDLWRSVMDFVARMSGERTEEDGYVTTPEWEEARESLAEKAAGWEDFLEKLPEEEKQRIGGYVDCLEDYASALEKRSYLQGMADCVFLLQRMGLMKASGSRP